MKNKALKKFAAATAITFLSAMTTTASADIIYEFSNNSTAVYGGSVLPGTTGVFATAKFTDVSNGIVELTLNVLSNLASSLYVDNWTFNLAGNNGNGNSPSISSVSFKSGVQGTVTSQQVTSGTNNVSNGTNGGVFDLGFSFAGLNPKELDAGSFSTYTLTGSNNFNASRLFVADDAGIFAAVRVASGNANTYIKAVNGGVATTPASSVPEPTSVALVGLGLLGFAAARRKAAHQQ